MIMITFNKIIVYNLLVNGNGIDLVQITRHNKLIPSNNIKCQQSPT